ncbi:transglycosylase SLT domain-containing protein [Nonomuraea sp. NPDC050153]|uniref:transglycosylase SLT domain-containing protein n=1 Tax=Nonomuraea sp. NPDC050153 TaxID=3364359 RepID=UPI0037B78E9C
MSALEEVRGAPGGAELAGLAAKVIGDPGGIAAAANAWRTAAGTGQRHTEAVRTATAGVGGAWQGGSAEAFAGYMGRVVRCGDGLRQALQECAGHLDAAASTLRAAESSALEICHSYAAAARQARGGDPPPTEEQVAQSLKPALDQARGTLRQLVADTGTILSDTAGKIQKALGTIPDVADELGEPDAQPFAPAPGKPLGWSPAQQESRPTTLAATGSSGTGTPGTGFGGYGSSGPPPPGGGPAPQGQIADWINQAVEILKANGYPVEKMNVNDIYTIIRHESGGNPNSINTWDSNWVRGTPSKGLMQTIDPTFQRWKLPGHDNVYNPVDNIIAGVRYAIERYGSVSNVPGVVGMKTGSGYRGY